MRNFLHLALHVALLDNSSYLFTLGIAWPSSFTVSQHYYYQSQMWGYLLCLAVVFICWKLYKNVCEPYFLIKFYKKEWEKAGHKILWQKFVPFLSQFIFDIYRDEKKHNDSYYTPKMIGCNYDAVVCNFGHQVLVILVKPELIKQFYALDATATYKKEQNFISNLKRVVGTSITFSGGEAWKLKRKFMTGFFNFQFINTQFSTISGIIQRKMEEFEKGRDEFEMELIDLLEQIIATTIVQLFFGGGQTGIQNMEIEGVNITKFMRIMMENLGLQTLNPISMLLGPEFAKRNVTSFDRKVSRQIRLFKQFTENFVKSRIYEIQEGKSKHSDYVQKIYLSVEEKERTPDFISKIVCDFSSLYIAGTETTSHSSMMMIYYIIMFPEVHEKLMTEIEEHIKGDEDIVYEKIKEMKYLDCVIHETLRYYQPANGIFLRQAQEDHFLGNLLIKKGTLLQISSLSNHYNPQNFKDPLKFQPERWLNEDGTFKNPKPFTWLTFSAGGRSCIGKQLAVTQMKLIAIHFFRKYKMAMQTTNLFMKLRNFNYQPQPLKTKFVKR